MTSLFSFGQWSKHLNTGSFPTWPNPVNSSDHSGAMEIQSDAITSNAGNANSTFSPNTIFTAYSSSPNSGVAASPQKGVWIVGMDELSGLNFSKKIFESSGTENLRIYSLQYDYSSEAELLIFTGERVQNSLLSQMVVGAYNLWTNTLSIEVIEQPFSFIDDEGNMQHSLVASRGIGVREIDPFSNTYLAIGQHGDEGNVNPPFLIPNNINLAVLPVGVIFQVSNIGAVTVNKIEIKDFMFKPHTVSDPLPNLVRAGGNGLVVAGERILDQLECRIPIVNEEACLYEMTLIRPAAYTFEAKKSGGTWNLYVERGMVLNTADWGRTNFSDGDPTIHVTAYDDNANRYVYLGMTIPDNTLTSSKIDGVGDLLLSRMSIYKSLGFPFMGTYTLIDDSRINLLAQSDDVYGSVQRLMYDPTHKRLSAVLNLDDVNNLWSRPNSTSIGLIEFENGNISPTSPIQLKSIYADDVAGNRKETEIDGVTAFQIVKGVSDKFTLLAADGNKQTTFSTYSRAHFNGSFTNLFPCEDYGTASEIVTTVTSEREYTFSTFSPSPTHNASNSFMPSEVGTFGWECHDYNVGNPLRKRSSLSSVIEEESTQIDIYPNPTSDKLFIKGNDEFQSYQIIDITGKIVKTGSSTDQYLETMNFKSGIYQIQFMNSDLQIIESKKFVKN